MECFDVPSVESFTQDVRDYLWGYCMRVNKLWISFFALKFGYMFLALFVYSRFTTLGDTDRYLSGQILSLNLWLFNSTLMMDAIAGSSAFFLGPIWGNIPFVCLSTYGIYYAVKKLDLEKNELLFLLLMLSLPNFGIWTSIASKEAVTVFFLGVILGFAIDLIKNNRNKDYLLVGVAFYLCGVFKPHYLIGIFSLIFYIYTSKKLNLKGEGKLILFVLFYIFSFALLYIFKNEINVLSFQIIDHFDQGASATRVNTMWLKDYDIFRNAFFGMMIAFIGPTLSEGLGRPTHLLVLLESLLIVSVFVYLVIRFIYISLKKGRLNIFLVALFAIPASWILFVHYPVGVLNPGSALRYRQGFYGFLAILFCFCYTEAKRRGSSFRLSNSLTF
jgi:hypothetical protein